MWIFEASYLELQPVLNPVDLRETDCTQRKGKYCTKQEKKKTFNSVKRIIKKWLFMEYSTKYETA